MSTFDSAVAAMDANILAVFGVPVTYTPAGGSSSVIDAIPDFSEEVRGTRGIAGTLWGRLSDFPSIPRKGDLVTYEGTDYYVRIDDIAEHLDGSGGITLWLRTK